MTTTEDVIKAERDRMAMYCHSLIAEIEYLQDATGENLDDEDADMVRQISKEANAIYPLCALRGDA